METQVDHELKNIFETKLKAPQYSQELSMLNLMSWDSLAHIGLILEIERRFKVNISSAEAIEMVSVRAIKEVLHEHGVA
jgi:acyl carrier protein